MVKIFDTRTHPLMLGDDGVDGEKEIIKISKMHVWTKENWMMNSREKLA